MGGAIISKSGGGIIPLQGGGIIPELGGGFLRNQQIRSNREVPADLKALFPTKPRFTADVVADRLRGVRDTIQHMEEKVLKAEIPEGTPFMLTATGDETPVHDSDQPNQTLKVIDRLIIGDMQIFFAELAEWLTEMGDCAAVISKYQRPKQ